MSITVPDNNYYINSDMGEWIEKAKKVHEDFKTYLECVQNFYRDQYGDRNTTEEEHILKQLEELKRIEEGSNE